MSCSFPRAATAFEPIGTELGPIRSDWPGLEPYFTAATTIRPTAPMVESLQLCEERRETLAAKLRLWWQDIARRRDGLRTPSAAIDPETGRVRE